MAAPYQIQRRQRNGLPPAHLANLQGDLNMQTNTSIQQPFGGIFALAAAALFVTALVVLGQAIGWPGILREPPSVVFPRIDANRMAMLFGYTCYLLSSLALIPVAFALRERFIASGVSPAVADTVTFFGAAGAILKTLGIVRWLSAMPTLASQYVAATTPEARSMLEVSYMTLNGYAGSVGELLGVQLVSGIWMAGVGILLLRQFGAGLAAKLVGALGMLAGIGFLIVTARIFFPSIAAVQAFINPIGLGWIVSLGVLMIWKRPHTMQQPSADSISLVKPKPQPL
jgi:hypothetical protein